MAERGERTSKVLDLDGGGKFALLAGCFQRNSQAVPDPPTSGRPTRNDALTVELSHDAHDGCLWDRLHSSCERQKELIHYHQAGTSCAHRPHCLAVEPVGSSPSQLEQDVVLGREVEVERALGHSCDTSDLLDRRVIEPIVESPLIPQTSGRPHQPTASLPRSLLGQRGPSRRDPAVTALSDDGQFRPIGSREGPLGDSPFCGGLLGGDRGGDGTLGCGFGGHGAKRLPGKVCTPHIFSRPWVLQVRRGPGQGVPVHSLASCST